MRLQTWLVACIICLLAVLPASAAPAKTVDQILQAYVQALGGQAAIDNIKTRELELTSGLVRRGVKLNWAAPDKVLQTERLAESGYDGTSGWVETKRKKVQKLPKARLDELETDANPIRFARLKDMYHELAYGDVVTVDGKPADVIVAPNSIGATKFFFDQGNHLLCRIEEMGVTSAYFKHTVQFSDYTAIDGVRLPLRITRESEEPGAEHGDVRLVHVRQNVPLDATIFRKPEIGRVISGGKR